MNVWAYPRVLMADIIAEVSHVFGIPEETIKGPERFREFVRPRFACSYLAKQLTSLSYPQIGRALGGRDHSTVLHGNRTAVIYMESEPEYRAYIDAVRVRLLSTRAREQQRRQEALAVARERIRLDSLSAAREALRKADAEAPVLAALLSEMDQLSKAVAAFKANGGSFVEVRA